MTTHPLFELRDRGRPIAASCQLEDAILHRLARRSTAVAACAELGDRVLSRVALPPGTVRVRITSVVGRRWYQRRRDLASRYRIGYGSRPRRLSGHQRHGADVNEGGNGSDGKSDRGEQKRERVTHGLANLYALDKTPNTCTVGRCRSCRRVPKRDCLHGPLAAWIAQKT